MEVVIPNGRTLSVTQLLTGETKNAKLNKAITAGYINLGLSLAPNWESTLYNTCPKATPGCIASCIYDSGYARWLTNVKDGRIAKTMLFYEQRELFKKQLAKEVGLAKKRAAKQNMKLAIRLNMYSDIMWEKVFPSLFKQFEDVQFYDYTKQSNRLGKVPGNYHLTFSRSESNNEEVDFAINAGYNVAVVFNKLPKKWRNIKVINGDKNDLRFLDPTPCIVGLKAKAYGKEDKTNFVEVLN